MYIWKIYVIYVCHIWTCVCIFMYSPICVCFIYSEVCTHVLCCAGLSKRPIRKWSARRGALGEWLRRQPCHRYKWGCLELRFVHVALAPPCLFVASSTTSFVACAHVCMLLSDTIYGLFYCVQHIGKGQLVIEGYGGAGFTGSYSVCSGTDTSTVVSENLIGGNVMCKVRDSCSV